ncbi:hypothetical protein A2U01_0103491, partial [Trifolium medium]|nr:hypothetical protein [Trifolium medium]
RLVIEAKECLYTTLTPFKPLMCLFYKGQNRDGLIPKRQSLRVVDLRLDQNIGAVCGDTKPRMLAG